MLMAFALVCAGWWSVAAAMPRHARPMLGRNLSPTWAAPVLRGLGAGLILSSLIRVAGLYGWAIGPVAWLGLCGAGAMMLVPLLTWRPAWAALPVASLLILGCHLSWIGPP